MDLELQALISSSRHGFGAPCMALEFQGMDLELQAAPGMNLELQACIWRYMHGFGFQVHCQCQPAIVTLGQESCQSDIVTSW